MFSFNCCFLICIQVSQQADKVVCYSHLFKNSPQIVVIHTKTLAYSMKQIFFLMISKKSDRMISVHLQGKPLNITVIQVYVPSTNAKEDQVEQFCEELQDLLELTPKKRCPLHYRGMECKCRKSRNTWSNRQVWLWSTK